jgi:hypothetical protein
MKTLAEKLEGTNEGEVCSRLNTVIDHIAEMERGNFSTVVDVPIKPATAKAKKSAAKS